MSLSDLARKVGATETFLPGAQPYPALRDSKDDRPGLEFRMDLARGLMRGTGFYDTLCRSRLLHPVSPDGMDVDSPPVPLLPSFDFYDITNPIVKQAILEQALPDDRDRMEKYGTARSPPIALITAPVCMVLCHVFRPVLTVSSHRAVLARHGLSPTSRKAA